MSTVLLLRHAQSAWNAEGRWQGQADPPLSPYGREQAATAARHLETLAVLGPPGGGRPAVDLVITSDLERARRTAEILAEGLEVGGLHRTEPLLRELDVGAWSGLTRPEIERRWPGELARFDAGSASSPPEGEERAEFDARVAAATKAVVRLVEEHRAGLTLVVTHGGVLRAMARLSGWEEIPVPNLGGYVARAAGGTLTLEERIDLLAPPPVGCEPLPAGPVL